jgi:hypothetical protein
VRHAKDGSPYIPMQGVDQLVEFVHHLLHFALCERVVDGQPERLAADGRECIENETVAVAGLCGGKCAFNRDSSPIPVSRPVGWHIPQTRQHQEEEQAVEDSARGLGHVAEQKPVHPVLHARPLIWLAVAGQ